MEGSGVMFFFILGILINTFYAVMLGSLLAGCLWVCTRLWKDIMS